MLLDPLKERITQLPTINTSKVPSFVSLGLVFVVSFLITAAVSLKRTPVPFIHNEFAHLLTGDTFASGRLTNPTHPLYQFFETIHILHLPSYASKLPPGQGIFLAIGQFFFDNPLVGIWLSTALATCTIFWGLQGYLKTNWSVLGVTIIFLHIGIMHHWSQSFRGAMVGVIGGALTFGALIRIIRYQKPHDAVLMGIGLGLMAITRPWEGLFFSIPLVGVLLVYLVKVPSAVEAKRRWWRTALPLIITLSLVLSLIATYNKAVTGNALQFPYQVYEKQYTVIRSAIWKDYRPEPNFRHEVMRKYSDWQYERMEKIKQMPLNQFLILRTQELFESAQQAWFGAFLWLIIVTVPLWIHRGWLQLAAFATLLALASHYLILPVRADQFSLATLTVTLLMTASLQEIAERIQKLPISKPFKKFHLILITALIIYLLYGAKTRYSSDPDHFNGGVSRTNRSVLVEQLLKQEGKDLVFVQQNAGIHLAFVYNEADIDASEIVFAQDMGETQNQKLINYYKDRKVWLQTFRANGFPQSLEPYFPNETLKKVE